MYCIIYDLLLRIVHYCYGGIIGINPLSADKAGRTVYCLRQRTEIRYGKAAGQLDRLPLDSNQRRLSGASWDWSLFVQSRQ